MIGTVYKSTGSWYSVKTSNGKFYECRMKGKLRLKGLKSTNPVAVGDHVVFELEKKNDVETGIIKRIEERRNYIVRKSVNLSKQTHIIAANIDQVFLLVTINNPPTLTSFIDRFLVTAEAYSIEVILLFNKLDSYNDDAIGELKYLNHIYSKIGYKTIEISATENHNVSKVKNLMIGKVNMFAGHSGVGKSSLINALEPGLNLKTKEISSQHMQGQHTTTFAEMYDLSFEASIIDTPGIKGFGVVDMEREEVSDYFPEFFKLKSQCKFHNCLHLKEPKCAVKEALDNDDIAYSRYRSYLQILEGDESQYRTDYWE
ncbi:ribosome small subunit-dependent GTPase A [Winogradskyella aurantiaca]|uniref:ribosome small subunit-dependent GTPase A n=1 Tax=Winogradskyella aurantiaca TaxID=2219558 RepID=UPI000E1D709A|nr:ribosome small subunit-dependent GTPase A [Winogradskyella aurantiaca]